MNSLSVDATGLPDIGKHPYDTTCQRLRNRFRIEVPGDIDFKLEQFETLNHHQAVNIRNTFAIKNPCGDSYVLLLDTDTDISAINQKNKIQHRNTFQPWALAYLKKDFGRVVIRTETIIDKIREIVFPIELDLKEDKAFSNRFYVLTDDRQKTEAAMTKEFRDAIMSIKKSDFVIEIYEHTLIIGNHKTVTPENTLYLADFVARLAELKC
ncbi:MULTISPECIES: hypothetical protein [unclassified Mucilaginibacter]|uniref:hypothetical protein n=1 Tax=unclassified Mucilaginibacter TaxID=2617802 RepID=UPI0009661763|nr:MULTISPECIES: hypothetical protein [unclassified Mucilaginibacter]OJW14803.1 MAG: hypothetical protein BGO48_11515 [Mucilaginibacter sp. 44-25]PLW90189.1 MAG: hypothetical protein C0154_07715 [Mucilaginibacter sp.]HEK19670.1 hypothetical protein [Bacteroidota bacterium]